MKQEQRFWNIAALGAFAGLCACSVWLVKNYSDTQPASLGFYDVALLGLGTFRLVHLLTYDKIFEVVRDPFKDRKDGKTQKAARGWRRLVCDVLDCLWCTGMWSALFAVTIYCLGPWGRFTVIVLAVAGLGSLLQVLSKAIAEKT